MKVKVEVKGLVVDPVTNMPMVVLRSEGGDRLLPIWVGVFEANAIALQLEGIATPRPMTHDLLRAVIDRLEAKVLDVVVSDLQDNTFHAVLHLERGGRVEAVDCRPSDAIALALRMSADIYVEGSVLERARVFDPTAEDPEELRSWFEGLGKEDLGRYEM